MKNQGPKQHYLPASYIGRFSVETEGRLRERKVYALRRGQTVPFPVSAQNIAAEHGLYTIQEDGKDKDFVDNIWRFTEDKLDCLDILEDNMLEYLPADIWAEVIIPFMAQLFVRHPKYTDGFIRYFKIVQSEASKVFNLNDSANFSRALEDVFFRTVLSHARWELCHNTTDTPLVTNDSAMLGARDRRSGSLGYAFPISPYCLLMVYRKDGPISLVKQKGNWYFTDISHRHLTEEQVLRCNTTTAEWALQTVIGGTSEVVSLACFGRSTTGYVQDLAQRSRALYKDDNSPTYGDVDKYYEMLRKIGVYHNLPLVLYHQPAVNMPDTELLAFAPPNSMVEFAPLLLSSTESTSN